MSDVELVEIIPEKDPRDILPTAYEWLKGLSWMTANELDAIVERIPRYGSILEIGTACGVTAAVIADRQRTVREIVCIDTFAAPDDAVAAEIMADHEPNRLEFWRANATRCMRLWVGDAGSYVRTARPDQFDVAIIDADHCMPGVLTDLVHAASVLKRDGVLIAHDYEDPSWPDVTVAVDHFCEAFGWSMLRGVGSLAFMRRAEWSR